VADKLTRAKIDDFVAAGVRDGKTEAMLWDGAVVGLGLRIRATGSASWLFQYRPRGGRAMPSRKATLGPWPAMTLAAARAAARIKSGQVASGADPVVERRVEKVRERNLLSKVLTNYEAALRQRKIVNAPTIMSTLRRGLAPLLAREVDTLSRKDIVARIDALEAAGKPGAAQDLRKHARTVLEFAVSKGAAPFNVLAGMRKPRASRSERLQDAQKGRALSDNQVRILWVSAAAMGPLGGLIQLALLTGLRRSELSGLKWSDIHDNRIVVEAEHAKTGVRHEVPLTAAMRSVLEAQPRTTSPLVFPGRGNVRMAGWSKAIPRARIESGVNFGLRDLRRTARTLMSRLGVVEETAELAIGHVRRGLVGTYNLDLAWTARVDAFQRVSAHIEAAAKPSLLATMASSSSI
jgi:integrase